MTIFVASCDNHSDTFYPFQHCMEKYWVNHPEVVYSTETVINPYYRTITKDYPLSQWSRRIRETVKELDDDQILLMVDDVFIRRRVDVKRVQDAAELLKGNVACVNFEKVYDSRNSEFIWTDVVHFMIRNKDAPWQVSIQCGLWDKEKLINVLIDDMDPWEIEERQPTRGYDYLINSGDYIIDYGYRNMKYFGLHNEKWCREVIPFFYNEGIQIDYSIRGIE